MAEPTYPDLEQMSFEQAMEELEGIVRALEAGQGNLEESIDRYQRGAQLKAHCEAKLREAEMKVEKISLGPDGAPAGTAAAHMDDD